MQLKQLLSVAALLLSSVAFSQNNFVGNPAISPDASQMAFSYAGDIWTYNFNTKQSKRLTVHETYDTSPVWHSDGKTLAFSSSRKNNNNIFITTTSGGVPTQLTFYPTSNVPTAWNNNDVVFTTKRVYAGPEWDAQIYSVNKNGETPSTSNYCLRSNGICFTKW